jgi:hypothetical protein
MSNTSHSNGGQPLVDYPDEPNQLTVVWAKANENTRITKLNDHLTDTNYNTWKGQMMLTLEFCGVEKYVMGTEEKPDVEVDCL